MNFIRKFGWIPIQFTIPIAWGAHYLLEKTNSDSLQFGIIFSTGKVIQ